MTAARDLLRGFLKRGGGFFLGSSLAYKLVTSLVPLYLVRVTSVDDFGAFEYARSVIFIFIPAFCLGLQEALLYFGANLRSTAGREQLYRSFLFPGVIGSLALTILIFLGSPLITKRVPEAATDLQIFSVYPITFGLFLLYSYKFRVIHRNDLFGLLNFLHAFYLAVFVLALEGWVRSFGAVAYVAAPAVAVVTVGLFRRMAGVRVLRSDGSPESRFRIREHLTYAIYVAAGGMASQLSLVVDGIMLGNIMADAGSVGRYRVIALIPQMLLFLPTTFIKSEFTYIAEGSSKEAWGYYVDYVKLFWLPSAVLITCVAAISPFVLNYLAGVELSKEVISASSLLYLFALICYLIRIPIGNILIAIGMARYNVIVSFVCLGFNAVVSFFLITAYGMIGAALSTVTTALLAVLLQVHRIVHISRAGGK